MIHFVSCSLFDPSFHFFVFGFVCNLTLINFFLNAFDFSCIFLFNLSVTLYPNFCCCNTTLLFYEWDWEWR